MFVPFATCGIWVPSHSGFPCTSGTNRGRSRFSGMRIREEDCNLVLLAGVTLASAVVAGAAALWEPASAVSKNRPIYAAAAASSPSANATATSSATARQPVRLVDQTPVRVIGAPFVPNTNPRER